MLPSRIYEPLKSLLSDFPCRVWPLASPEFWFSLILNRNADRRPEALHLFGLCYPRAHLAQSSKSLPGCLGASVVFPLVLRLTNEFHRVCSAIAPIHRRGRFS